MLVATKIIIADIWEMLRREEYKKDLERTLEHYEKMQSTFALGSFPRVVMDDAEKVVQIYADAELYEYFRKVRDNEMDVNLFTLSRVYSKLKKLLEKKESIEHAKETTGQAIKPA